MRNLNQFSVFRLTRALSHVVSALPNSSASNAPKAHPRGIKRSRSPEQIADVPLDDGM